MGRAKRKKYSNFNDFVALPRKALYSKEWHELGSAAKLLYIHLKAKYNGQNNGEICLSYSELRGIKGISSSSTISKAFYELEKKEWITHTFMGGLFRHINKYKLTGKYDDHISW